MNYYIVAVRDRALDAFGRPVYVQALAHAIRSFQDEINRHAPDNEMSKHPEDYDLYYLATYNDDTGQFTNTERPTQIAIGKQLSTEE